MTYSPRTNINRLLRLADLLRSLPKKQFNMEEIVKEGYYKSKVKPECGSVCCIAGWATCIHPDLTFDELGGLLFRGSGDCYDKVFARAFGVDHDVAGRLTHYKAPHQTPKAAARAVEKVARDLAKQHGYEIV